MTPREQGRRRESSFLPRFFWISLVERDFEKRIFRKCVCARVRPSVRPFLYPSRKPIALESVDFASPKMRDSMMRQIPRWALFLPSNQSILCRERGLRQKSRYLLSKRFPLFVKFTRISFFLLCHPNGGVPSKNALPPVQPFFGVFPAVLIFLVFSAVLICL